jgi:hypothetical protein
MEGIMSEPKFENTYKCHVLKTDPEAFGAVLIGLKKYEIRFDDRGFSVGDDLILRETKYTGDQMKNGAELIYTDRVVNKTISHILKGPVYGLKDGWVILSFV